MDCLSFQKTTNYEGLADANVSLGLIYYTQEDYLKSIETFNKAYIAAKQIEYKEKRLIDVTELLASLVIKKCYAF